ncbi:MAG: capsule assembly Wzi family protein [Desulfuromonadales bacterium]|nr:capsule assembly Wzi family protein [Desulfuromonadales bacterium]
MLSSLIVTMLVCVEPVYALSSANIPLNSPLYGYLDKLAGMGLITSDVKGLRPYSKAEAARLVLEAQKNLALQDAAAPAFAGELIKNIRESIPREVSLRETPDKKPRFIDYNPVSSLQLRYVYLDGVPRDYNRPVFIRGGQSAFGFIGGTLRPESDAGVLNESGTEGTPLVENNNGIIYKRGNNVEMRLSAEGYISDKVSALLEPMLQYSPDDTRFLLNRGYIKLGGGGLELEAGRDENWFGPGYRGALTLSSNAKNFDQVKLSSPEPLDVAWVKRWLGDVKYALIVSQFNETDAGTPERRRPYFVGVKLAAKPYSWFEYGINFVRQQGGPGFTGSTTFKDEIFGGGYTNHNNSIAGLDMRFRIPWLRNTEVYGEYAGEDSASFWPIVESYVAGIYAPCLTAACRDDLRFEFFWGNPMLYTDFKFPRGYTYENMSPGHSQGGAAQDFFVRYSHSFSVRNRVALEYFHTDRGQEGRVRVNNLGQYDPINGVMQAMEHKDAGRISWTLPIHGDVDGQLLYGVEKISNLNLVEGAVRTNQLVSFELRYRY